ncbi:MAG: hypothetical protein P8M60_00525 [Flavobacteriaceae bacterium]|nr:hypothetical protein [Flavobacteriaceae bacterium]
MGLIFWLSYFSGMSFLGFGLSCFLNPAIKKEFDRYGLSKYRTTTGFFQLIGAFGILITDHNLTLWNISSLGLSVLMLLGFIVRIRLKDNFIQSFPSFFYMLLNGYIYWNI